MKRIALIALLALLFAPSLHAATLDTLTTFQCGNTGALSNCTGVPTVSTVLTISYTTGGGSNTALSVRVKASCNTGATAPTITSMTYNTSQTLSQTATVNGGSAARYISLWSLAAGTQPTAGAHNLVVTFGTDIETVCAAANTITVYIQAASSVDQTTTYSSTNTNSGGSAGPATVTLASSGASDKGIMSACVGDTFTGTLSSGLTQTFKYDDTATGCSSDIAASSTGGTTVHSANLSASDSWLILAAAFKDVGGGGGGSTPRNFLSFGIGQ